MDKGIQLNYLLVSFLVLYFLAISVRVGLHVLNSRHLRRYGGDVPGEFSGFLDPHTLGEMRDYALVTDRLGAVEHLVRDLVLLVLVLWGLPILLSGMLSSWGIPFALSGAVFFLSWYLILGIFGLPFDLYRTFDIERRFSFSTISRSTWVTDLLKTVLVSGVTLGAFLLIFFSIVRYAPHTWWLWSWLFLIAFQALITWIYPVVIAPWFNRFEPVRDQGLAQDISSLAKRAGITLKGIYQMDALKRSRHSNAYFTGIGKSRRIILFDTLLKDHSRSEILAVLAHEIGHWKMGHVMKQMLLSASVSLLALYGAYHTVQQEVLYRTFGFDRIVVYAGFLFLAVLIKPVVFFLHPLGAMISRRFERQSDEYSSGLIGSPEPLISALKRLAAQNLSNLDPHPAYAWFFYSHPPIVERIRRLKHKEGDSRAFSG